MNGIILGNMLIGGGTASQDLDVFPCQQCFRQLFSQMKHLIEVDSSEPGEKICILNFLNSNGDWFGNEYVFAKLHHTIVDQVDGNITYVKTFH